MLQVDKTIETYCVIAIAPATAERHLSCDLPAAWRNTRRARQAQVLTVQPA